MKQVRKQALAAHQHHPRKDRRCTLCSSTACFLDQFKADWFAVTACCLSVQHKDTLMSLLAQPDQMPPDLRSDYATQAIKLDKLIRAPLSLYQHRLVVSQHDNRRARFFREYRINLPDNIDQYLANFPVTAEVQASATTSATAAARQARLDASNIVMGLKLHHDKVPVCGSCWCRLNAVSSSTFDGWIAAIRAGHDGSHGNKGARRLHTISNAVSEALDEAALKRGDYAPDDNIIALPERSRKQLHESISVTIKAKYGLQASLATVNNQMKRKPHLKLMGQHHTLPQCSTCCNFKSNLDPSQAALDQHRVHQLIQQNERTQAELNVCHASEQPEEFICIAIDGMDQAKTELPAIAIKPKFVDKLYRLGQKLTGVLVWSNNRSFCYASAPHIQSRASYTIHVLLDTLQRVFKEIADSIAGLPAPPEVWDDEYEVVDGARHKLPQPPRRRYTRYPTILILHMDNSGKDNKNNALFSCLAHLVQRGWFKEIRVNFLIVGHTHDRVDQFFSCISRHLQVHDAWTVKQLSDAVTASYGQQKQRVPRPGEKDQRLSKPKVIHLHSIAEWSTGFFDDKPKTQDGLLNAIKIPSISEPQVFRIYLNALGDVLLQTKPFSMEVTMEQVRDQSANELRTRFVNKPIDWHPSIVLIRRDDPVPWRDPLIAPPSHHLDFHALRTTTFDTMKQESDLFGSNPEYQREWQDYLSELQSEVAKGWCPVCAEQIKAIDAIQIIGKRRLKKMGASPAGAMEEVQGNGEPTASANEEMKVEAAAGEHEPTDSANENMEAADEAEPTEGASGKKQKKKNKKVLSAVEAANLERQREKNRLKAAHQKHIKEDESHVGGVFAGLWSKPLPLPLLNREGLYDRVLVERSRDKNGPDFEGRLSQAQIDVHNDAWKALLQDGYQMRKGELESTVKTLAGKEQARMGAVFHSNSVEEALKRGAMGDVKAQKNNHLPATSADVNTRGQKMGDLSVADVPYQRRGLPIEVGHIVAIVFDNYSWPEYTVALYLITDIEDDVPKKRASKARNSKKQGGSSTKSRKQSSAALPSKSKSRSRARKIVSSSKSRGVPVCAADFHNKESREAVIRLLMKDGKHTVAEVKALEAKCTMHGDEPEDNRVYRGQPYFIQYASKRAALDMLNYKLHRYVSFGVGEQLEQIARDVEAEAKRSAALRRRVEEEMDVKEAVDVDAGEEDDTCEIELPDDDDYDSPKSTATRKLFKRRRRVKQHMTTRQSRAAVRSSSTASALSTTSSTSLTPAAAKPLLLLAERRKYQWPREDWEPHTWHDVFSSVDDLFAPAKPSRAVLKQLKPAFDLNGYKDRQLSFHRGKHDPQAEMGLRRVEMLAWDEAHKVLDHNGFLVDDFRIKAQASLEEFVSVHEGWYGDDDITESEGEEATQQQSERASECEGKEEKAETDIEQLQQEADEKDEADVDREYGEDDEQSEEDSAVVDEQLPRHQRSGPAHQPGVTSKRQSRQRKPPSVARDRTRRETKKTDFFVAGPAPRSSRALDEFTPQQLQLKFIPDYDKSGTVASVVPLRLRRGTQRLAAAQAQCIGNGNDTEYGDDEDGKASTTSHSPAATTPTSSASSASAQLAASASSQTAASSDGTPPTPPPTPAELTSSAADDDMAPALTSATTAQEERNHAIVQKLLAPFFPSGFVIGIASATDAAAAPPVVHSASPSLTASPRRDVEQEADLSQHTLIVQQALQQLADEEMGVLTQVDLACPVNDRMECVVSTLPVETASSQPRCEVEDDTQTAQMSSADFMDQQPDTAEAETEAGAGARADAEAELSEGDSELSVERSRLSDESSPAY